ncbi:sensor histidine kinase [Polyangium mundeleinium]|uniref:histidine kinase n=1 Tax=Polyangium mundeleinium TaxID=2995306 RepID=A0ABT5EMB3_9BACT|nr:PAS domain S-box protein [Polyangium mundeleinium]MDC0742985.1 PAS domain S-box protein [Polyangium mundeleinium]
MAGADTSIVASSEDTFSTLAARLLSSSVEPRDAHRIAVDFVASALGTHVTLFYGVSEDGRTLAVSAHHGAPEALLARLASLPLESASLIARVARTRKAAEVDAAAKDAPFDARVAAEIGCGQRALAAPLIAGERLLGLLVCFTPTAESGRDRTLPMLSAFASLIGATLGSARPADENALRRSQERLARAQRIAHIGSWEWEIGTNEVFWSDECFRLFGLPPSAEKKTYEDFLSFVHPDDRAEVDEVVRGALSGDASSYSTDHRILAVGDRERIMHVDCDVIRDDAGRALRMWGTVQDVTEQRRAEKALQKSEALFRQVLETLPVGVWVSDEHGNVILMNPAGQTIWNETRFVGPERFDEFKAWWVETGNEVKADEWALSRAVKKGETALNELIEIQAFDGSRKIVLNSAAPVRDPKGRIIGGFVINQDVTAQRRAEMALQKSEALFRKVLETLPVGVWVSDEHGNLVLINPAGQRIWGGVRFVGPEEFDEYKGWWVDTGKEVKSDEWALSRAVKKGETALNELVEIQTFDGIRKFVLNSAAPVRDPNGRFLGAFAINDDVTEQRRLEAERERLVHALSTERRWLRTVIDRSPIGIVLCKLDKEPEFLMNHKAEELMGEAMPTDVLGLLRQRLHLPDGSPVPDQDLSLNRALRGEVVTGRELLVRTPHEPDVPVLNNASPIRNEEGEIVGAVVTYEDITPLKELERLRQEWTSVVAHDLRQPVTTIMTLAGALARSGADATARSRGERIVGSAARLSRMIGDLLDGSRIETHRLELLRAPTDIPALLGRVIEASDNRERVTISIHGEIPALFVDAQRIEQVAENLLSNAVKYGFPGTPIELLAERRGDEVVVAVRNQGPGIPPEDMRTLFERFQRGRAKGSMIKGLGLGLYIVRGLVEAHGGRVEAHSVPGEITMFSLSLPIDTSVEGIHEDTSKPSASTT